MTTQVKEAVKTETAQLKVLDWINIIYGSLGLAIVAQLTTGGSWKSFALGWVVAVLNLELLKRLGLMLVAVYDGKELRPLFFVFLIAKFAFLGLVIAMFTMVDWIQGIPFILGTTTLLVSGLGLGVKEFLYARTS